MLSQEALQHVSWGAGNTLCPVPLLGSVSPIVSGTTESTMSVGSKVSQMSSIVREVTGNISDAGTSFLAPDPGSRPAICHISTVPLPTPI